MSHAEVNGSNYGIMPPNLPPSASPFLVALAAHQDQFLRPSESLHAATLALAKHYLDPVALSVSTLQLERLALSRRSKKRKRGAEGPKEAPLKLKAVALDGFDAHQVWEQVRRITEAVGAEVGRVVDDREVVRVVVGEGDESDQSTEESDEDESGEFSDGLEKEELEDEDVGEAGLDDEDDDMEEDSEEESDADTPVQTLRKDKFGLNDGFFDIDEFNRRADMLERQDDMGEPDADAGSDEEDIEWEMDPASLRGEEAKGVNIGPDEDDSEDEDGGPTFGNVDLYAPEGASEDEQDDDEDADAEAEGLKYNEFFDPPPGKGHPGKKNTKLSKSKHVKKEEDFEENIERTMAAVHRDLYSDESDGEEILEEEETLPGASTHEKRKATLTAQIRELEALNVAKRPWTLSGEAGAKDRPVNAILEEHLDFERAGKPLPVITAETSEEIEQLIKRRILAGEFDEVRRRRPDEVLLSGSTRRGRQEEDNLENQPKRGLAEVYEEEHLRRTDAAYVDKKTEKLNKEHAEIESLWKDIVTKLDSLASWRYRPKPTELSVSVRSDAPAMTMEDARPSGAGGEVGALAQLAPQEVYKPGETKEQGKVVTKGGTVVDRAELSQDNRKRQRRREKERIKKAQGQSNGEANGAKKQTSAKTLAGDLKKSGVKIIGRKGELRDVEGNEVKDGPRLHGSSLKL